MQSEIFPSFEPNPSFPQLSSAVTVYHDERRGRFVKALRDIPSGEVICIDTGKVISLDPEKCIYCLSAIEVAERRYCSRCVAIHERISPFEAPFISQLQKLGMMQLAIRLMLSYPMNQIKKVVERRTAFPPTYPVNSDDFSSVAALMTDRSRVDISQTDEFVSRIVDNLSGHPEWSQLDPDERKSLFHKGLRVLSAKLMTNAHTIFFLNQIEQQNCHLPPVGVGLFPTGSIFNHGCRANTNSFFHENKFIFVSAGIRKGEEVLDNYGASYYQHTKKERKAFLAERGFDCKCVACSSDESIDDLLGKAISHPEVVLKSLNNVGDFRKLRRVLPAGHKEIEMIAEMYIGAVGGDDPEERLYLYSEALECQRYRGLYFGPEQIRLLLLCVLCHYDIAASSDSLFEKRNHHIGQMQIFLFSAIMRMRSFYCTLYPVYFAAMNVTNEMVRLHDAGLSPTRGPRDSYRSAVLNLRNIMKSIQPSFNHGLE